MLRNNRHYIWSVLLIVAVLFSLLRVNVAFADDSTTPPPPTEAPTEPPVAEELPSTEAGSTEEVPGNEEIGVLEVLQELPENAEIVVLDERGNPVPLASQEALDAILEDDPMWCPGSTLPGGAGCRNFTGANGIVNLLADMQANTSIYDGPASSIIYFTSNPGNGAFTLTNATASLGSGDFATLRTTNITLMGGWNGSNGGSATFTGQTNFGTNYVQVGTSGNPWVGNVTINNMTVDGHTSANASISVFTTTGSVTMDDILVDNAGNNESIRVSTGSGNITITDTDVTDGDGDYALYLTTTSGIVTLNNVAVDDHTDSEMIRIVGGNGAVNLTNVDVTDGDDGNAINISTTGGSVNLTDVDVAGNSDGDGLTVTTTSGNINLNDMDVFDHVNGRTGNLVSQSGNIFITNNSFFEGDGTSLGFSASTNTGSITITGSAGNEIDFLDASGPGGTNYNGATLTAPIVSLTYVIANNSDGHGIAINATTSVTLNNVTANDNGTNPSGAGNANGSGVRVNGDGSTLVNVTGGSFNDNEAYGIEIYNATYNFISMPSFNNNGLGPYFPGGQDTTGPVITPNVFCSSWGTNGWCRGLVLLVSWSVTEPESRVSSTSGCGSSLIGNTSSAGQTLTCSATSADGTLSSSNSVTVYQDTANPTASATRSPAANAFGWNNTDVTVTFSGTDAHSGIAFCTAPITRTANGANQSATGNCTDVAGNVSSNVTINNINIDKTPPTISLLSRTPANGNGWNNTDVVVTWSCTDSLSGAVSGTVSQTVSSEGANQSATGTCQDRAGNSASATETGINVDKTPPTLNVPGSMTPEATTPAGAVVNFSASVSDNLDSSVSLICSPPSGTLFILDAPTLVTCTATDDADNTTSGSFTVTVQDTTPPVISPMAGILVHTTDPAGEPANYTSPTTFDIVDGAGVATCSPASGSLFPPGDTTVTCTATDSRGNTSSITFNVHINLRPLSVLSTFGGGFILVTGGELIDLDCTTVVNAFGVIVKFHNLCDNQAVINEVGANALPGALPNGYNYVQGLDVQVLANGQALPSLPDASGVELNFPLPESADFAVLYWNNGQWVEITQPMNVGDMLNILSKDAAVELYKMSSSNSNVENVLTTDLTGTFVLVKK